MKRLFFSLAIVLFTLAAGAQQIPGITYTSNSYVVKKKNPFTGQYVDAAGPLVTAQNWITVSDQAVRIFCAACSGNAAFQFNYANELPRTSRQGDYSFTYYKAYNKDNGEEVTVSLCYLGSKLIDVTLYDATTAIIYNNMTQLNQ